MSNFPGGSGRVPYAALIAFVVLALAGFVLAYFFYTDAVNFEVDLATDVATREQEKAKDVGKKKAVKSKRKDEDDEEMISFDEFLVDDVAEPKKKKRRPARKNDEKPRKPKLSTEERRRAAKDTDALPPSQAGKKRAAPRPASKKTLVVECEECGMRLVFKNGKKPISGAKCPACGEKLRW